MKTLNLPKTEFKIISRGEKLNIFDILRRRYVTLTPEEWVRQHFIHFSSNTRVTLLPEWATRFHWTSTERENVATVYFTIRKPALS